MFFDVLSNASIGPSWNLTFSRDLYEWEVDLSANLLSSLNENFILNSFLDKNIWILESSGRISSKSFLTMLCDYHFVKFVPFQRI